MIEDLSRTLEEILESHLADISGAVDIKFEKPSREWSATLAKPTINLYLYDVRENVELRQGQHWEVADPGNPNTGQKARLKRSPLRIDCKYMITAWAEKPEDEHQLLSLCLLVLGRYNILPKELCIGKLLAQPYKIPAQIGRHDQLTNPAEVWGALDNDLRPTLSYVVTLAFNPWDEIEVPILTSLSIDFSALDKGQVIEQPEERPRTSTFMGLLTGDDNQPVGDAEIDVVGTGITTSTNPRGEYLLRGLHSGKTYTLRVRKPTANIDKEIKITVP